MKRVMATVLACCLLWAARPARAADMRLEPAWPVPDYVTWLLEVASGEVGYREGAHGYSKYGEWAGDPYCQWCAEFLCWCVDQVDQQHGTQLLKNVYPLYSGQNTGRSWFIQQGRYLVRWGNLEGWGYQWLKDEDHFLTTGDYIPQPGDWVFFTWTNDENTDHVAMVEYCTVDGDGAVSVHVIEGNTPAEVKRAVYPLTYSRILGFGTVRDVCDWTMRAGNRGEKVRQLQEKLAALGYVDPDKIDGNFGGGTQEAVRLYQLQHGLKVNGVANISTQLSLNRAYSRAMLFDPSNWLVTENTEPDEDFTLDGLGTFADIGGTSPAAGEADDQDFSIVGDEDEDDVSVVFTDEVPDWLEQ